MADIGVAGYPTGIGGKQLTVIDHFGPLSYVTGGEVWKSEWVALSGFDFITPNAYSTSGNYRVVPYYPAGIQGRPGNAASQGTAQVTLVWYGASGAEVAAGTNLSGEVVRLQAIGE